MIGGIALAAGMATFRKGLERHVPWLPLAITLLAARRSQRWRQRC
ncbi:MAG TPA: hypothetical protein VFC00_12890 [Micromonosporaceae bacterium]|nr:hypothetical protein [Micromonosporaceae bacterium]